VAKASLRGGVLLEGFGGIGPQPFNEDITVEWGGAGAGHGDGIPVLTMQE